MHRLVALAAFTVATLALAAPGEEWDIALEIDMPGMPPGMVPPQKFRSCGPKRTDAPPFTGAQSNDECQVSDAKKTGSTWTWKMTCKSGMKGSGMVTLKGPDAFVGKSDLEMEGNLIKSKIAGKRVGPCDYKGPPPSAAPAAPAKTK
jgi:hypothetical protein